MAQKKGGKPPRDDDKTQDAELSQEVLDQIAAVRDRVHGAFGQMALSMMVLPRYRHLSLAELQRVLLEPLLRDRVALAQDPAATTPVETAAGAVIWASVSDEVDAKIREQIKAGVFPLRLEPDDWTSGDNNWVLDVIAPSQELTKRVLISMGKLVVGGDLRIHPMVTRVVGAEALEQLGARRGGQGD